MDALRIEVVTGERAFFDLKEAWNRLVERDSTSTLFQTWEWNYHIWNFVEKEWGSLQVACVRAGDGELAGIMPLSLRNRRFAGMTMRSLEFIGARHLDYKCPVVDDRLTGSVIPLLAGWIRDRKTAWDRVFLEKIRWPDERLNPFVRELEKGEVPVLSAVTERAPYLPLRPGAPVEEQLEDPSFKKYLRRKMRKVQKDFECRLTTVKDPEELDDAFPRFVGLNKARARDKLQIGTFRSAAREAFFDFICRDMLAKDLLNLHFLDLSGRKAAGLLNFRWRKSTCFFQSGFDLNFRKYSLGHVIHCLAIQEALERGDREYDFLNGDEPYKAQWTSRARELTQITMVRAKLKQRMAAGWSWIAGMPSRVPVLKKLYFLLHGK